jgi:hypothetical protein
MCAFSFPHRVRARTCDRSRDTLAHTPQLSVSSRRHTGPRRKPRRNGTHHSMPPKLPVSDRPALDGLPPVLPPNPRPARTNVLDQELPSCSSSAWVAYSTIGNLSSPSASSRVWIWWSVSNNLSPVNVGPVLGLMIIVICQASLPSESKIGAVRTFSITWEPSVFTAVFSAILPISVAASMLSVYPNTARSATVPYEHATAGFLG